MTTVSRDNHQVSAKCALFHILNTFGINLRLFFAQSIFMELISALLHMAVVIYMSTFKAANCSYNSSYQTILLAYLKRD
jgi:hypothetical protein